MLNSQLRRQNKRLLNFVIVALSSLMTGVAASDGIALSARVVNADVSYTIASAERSFDLREDAVVALAAGDTLTTGRTGRVYLQIEEGLEVLILPNTQLAILASEVTEDQTTVVRLRIDGNAVTRFSVLSQAPLSLEFEASQSTIRASEGWFAIWSNIDNRDIVTVAEGSISIEAASETQSITAEEALQVNGASISIIPIEPPYNGARIIGMVDGCDGRVRSLLPELNIRAGTTLGYTVIGFFDNGDEIRILGRTVDENWYRIQRFSGFGWVLSSAVQTDCVPPEYPNLYGENNRELFNVEGIELVLLTPFYGSFESDPWFYRWMEPPGA